MKNLHFPLASYVFMSFADPRPFMYVMYITYLYIFTGHTLHLLSTSSIWWSNLQSCGGGRTRGFSVHRCYFKKSYGKRTDRWWIILRDVHTWFTGLLKRTRVVVALVLKVVRFIRTLDKCHHNNSNTVVTLISVNYFYIRHPVFSISIIQQKQDIRQISCPSSPSVFRYYPVK